MQKPAPASPARESITLTHDYLLVMRGAERTFAAIAELYPRAPIFTLLYDEQATQGRFASYTANSELTRERIKRYYGRESVVIHPPVETDRFAAGSPGDSLLVVSELVRHKRLHVALEAARRARAPICVVGTGPERDAL